MRHVLSVLATAAVGLCVQVSAPGAMTKDVEWVRPRIGQRGRTVEVLIQGAFLASPRELVFYKPGIKAVALKPMSKLRAPISLAHGGRIEEEVRAVLEIAADCELGEHPFRLRTDDGLSLLSTFHVTPFPVVAEAEPNDTIVAAQSVEPNVTVLGSVDTDMFKVDVLPGSRLSVEVDCVRLSDILFGDAEFDLAIRIRDETGKILARNDENALHVQDPLVSLKIPDDFAGTHVFVEVRQSNYAPRSIPYCVHIGTFRRPLAAFPAGGKSGERLAVKFVGDALGEFNESVSVPVTPGAFRWFGDAPSPLSLRASAFGNVVESPADEETRVPELPIALNGILETPGETDSFRLTVKKGDRYRIRVFASSLGNPIDPVISIRPMSGDRTPSPAEVRVDDSDLRLADRDLFGTSIRGGGGEKDVLDPSVIWEPKSDGEYLLDVSDSSGAGGPAAVYRIEIESPPQSIFMVLASRFFDWAEGSRATGFAVPQGNRWTVTIDIARGQGTTYSGPFDIVAEGLPEGVQLISPRVPGTVSKWPVQLVADAAAVPAAKIFTLGARPVDPSVALEARCQQAVPFVTHSGGDAWRILRVDRFAAAVTQSAPIAIELVQPTAPLVRGGELFIPVRLTRKPGYEEPVEFQADFAPPGVGLPPKDTIPASCNEAILQISAERNAPLGRGLLYVMATTLGGNDYLGSGRVRVSSQLIEIEVAEPFVEFVSEPLSARRGGKTTASFAVVTKRPFAGEAKVRLLGLPKGVSALGEAPRITKDSKHLSFEVEVTDEALLGLATGLECEVVVNCDGQEIRQRAPAGKGTLRIDPRL